jgi:pimeloyl-ACP methyl ester carboxylesterase
VIKFNFKFNTLFIKCLFFAFLSFSPSVRAVQVIDLFQWFQSWAIRWKGYRTYKLDLKLSGGQKCRVALTAHVNPKVDKFTLLLHGMGDSRFSWWKWISLYEDHPLYSSFIAVDWPPHGDSNCKSAIQIQDIVDVIDRTVRLFGRPIERIIGNSLGVLPAALLAERYPEAQQVWLAVPLLKEKALQQTLADVMAIDTTHEVQIFMNRVLTQDRDLPEFLREEFLVRIARSQEVLKSLDLKTLQKDIYSRKYHKLLVIAGSNDELLIPQEIDPRVSQLSSYPIQFVPCGHDLLRHCGEDLRILVEQTRYNLQNATY